ncbi:uncharacterized protein si:ch211-106e7.2 isoform X1 [Silurus meridionalis]|nr:uncharacterized protein si:ch211-106e7.2 isoform X1 [Silurus meridionalis]
MSFYLPRLHHHNLGRMKTFLQSQNMLQTNGKAGEQPLLQKCPFQFNSSPFEHQNPSSVSTINVPQQSVSHLIVVNNLGGSWKNNLYSHQQLVEITSNLPEDTTSLGFFADVGHFGAIVAKDQIFRLRQQNACMAKDINQQKYAPQEAISVVTPLTQKVVEGVTFSKNLNKKEISLETSFVPNKADYQPHIPQVLQSTNERGAGINDNTSQTKKSSSKSVLATEILDCVMGGPDENNNVSGQSEILSSFPHGGGDNRSAKFPRGYDARVIDRNSVSIKTRMDNLSTIPVTEWTLQKLHTLVTVLEQKQKRQQKDMPFTDLFSEILKLYWNGNHKDLCSAARSKMYVNTMKEVRLHCGTDNSVILQAVSRERLKESESSFHILEHCFTPPKMVYTSSWLNLSENLNDTDQKPDCVSSLMTLHCKPKPPDKGLPKKELDNMQDTTNETIKACNKAQSGEEEQSKPLPTEQQMNSSDKIRGHTAMDVKNKCSVKKTAGQDSMTLKNVLMECVPSEKTNTSEDKNEAPLQVSLSTQSSDVSDSFTKPGNLIQPLSTHMTTLLEKTDIADCVSVKVSVLPPEKAQRLFTDEPDEEVHNIQKEDAKILTDSKGQATAESFDKDKKQVDPAIEFDKKSNTIKINCQVENYCCLAKWFQALGYRNRGNCKCEIKADAVTFGIGVNGLNSAKHRHPFHNTCQLTDMDNRELRKTRKAKNRFAYRGLTGKKHVASPIDDDASMDEFEIVDVITNYEDVLELANSVSMQLIEKPLKRCTLHKSTTGKKHRRDHQKEITMPEIKTGDAQINLALYGTSRVKQKKNISMFTSSDKVPIPPKTINVKIGSGGNKYWNSQKKTSVLLRPSNNRRSKKLKHAKAPESNLYAADNSVIKTTSFDLITTLPCHEESAQNQPKVNNGSTLSLASADNQKKTATSQSKKKPRKKISSTRKDKIMKLKRNTFFSSFNFRRKCNSANNTNELIKTSFDPAQPNSTSKNKLNTGVALNFGVLPASFNILEGSSSMEANQSVSADSGSKDKSMLLIKRKWAISGTWCDSPRKKQCLKSTPTLPNTSGLSTFQEFKKKYEKKNQNISV